MDSVTKAVKAAHKAAESLEEHPNSPGHVKARAMALVAVVNACGGSQTLASRAMGYKDRQLINRQVRRALERGWVSRETVDGKDRLVVNRELPRQTEITDLVEVETIDPTVTMWPADATGETPPDKPPILPPFSLPEPYAY